MTCFLPSKRATPVLVPATVHYSRNFHAPIFKRVTVVNTVSVIHTIGNSLDCGANPNESHWISDGESPHFFPKKLKTLLRMFQVSMAYRGTKNKTNHIKGFTTVAKLLFLLNASSQQHIDSNIIDERSDNCNNGNELVVVVVDVDDVDDARTDAATRLVCNWKHTREERIARRINLGARSHTQENNLRKNNDTHDEDFGDRAGNDSPEFVTTKELTRRRVVVSHATPQARTGRDWSSRRRDANESDRRTDWILDSSCSFDDCRRISGSIQDFTIRETLSRNAREKER
ncbi:hypothetical protein G5I_01972 [Acromyrmex echinatior]|uniref:Uncharacterized protein n=1 Tax=Acromyrmex echinatior TaxID=103372 RepID=F4W926_ACREC|nr:hypothetical protein G5I_01972 [Acromyrmex echinatior]